MAIYYCALQAAARLGVSRTPPWDNNSSLIHVMTPPRHRLDTTISPLSPKNHPARKRQALRR
jgi:hypothetical protein